MILEAFDVTSYEPLPEGPYVARGITFTRHGDCSVMTLVPFRPLLFRFRMSDPMTVQKATKRM